MQRYSAQQHTGNPVLDVILTTKERACADRGISVHRGRGRIAVKSGMSSMDIASLFGNALDNAIEATSKLAEMRNSDSSNLRYTSKIHFTVVRVENYYDSRLKKDAEGNLRTTKRDDQHRHGFGVKSIQSHRATVRRRSDDSHRRPLVRADRAAFRSQTGLMAI